GSPDSVSKCATCPWACTPASVRPAPTITCSDPVSCFRAVSSTPCTVRRSVPVCLWKPLKPVPSYSTVSLRRRIPVLALYEFHECHGGAVTAAVPCLQDARVAAMAFFILGSDFIKQLL